MKKYISLLSFAIVIIMGTQNMQAQKTLSLNKDRPESIAKSQIEKLSKPLDLSAEQKRSLFRVFVKKEVAYKKQIKGRANSNAVKAAKAKIDSDFDIQLKLILTPEQYALFKEI